MAKLIEKPVSTEETSIEQIPGSSAAAGEAIKPEQINSADEKDASSPGGRKQEE